MPYANNDDLPPAIRQALPPHAQDIFRSAFNSAWNSYGRKDPRGPTGSQIGHKDSVRDTARVLGRMYDAIEFRGYSQEAARELAQLSSLIDPSRFPPGPMGSKLEAANAFVAATAKPASVGRLKDGVLIAQRLVCTTIETSLAELILRQAYARWNNRRSSIFACSRIRRRWSGRLTPARLM